MIFNTYPLNQDQKVPDFVKNFYTDLRKLLIDELENYTDCQSAVSDLLKMRKLNASISLNTIKVDDWESESQGNYMILCWQDKVDQHAFIKHYSNKPNSKKTTNLAFRH